MENKVNESNLHRDCAEHDAANCDINTHNNLVPGDDDCGHTVNAGPGVGAEKYKGTNATVTAGPNPNPAGKEGREDVGNGPGVGVDKYDGKGHVVETASQPPKKK